MCFYRTKNTFCLKKMVNLPFQELNLIIKNLVIKNLVISSLLGFSHTKGSFPSAHSHGYGPTLSKAAHSHGYGPTLSKAAHSHGYGPNMSKAAYSYN